MRWLVVKRFLVALMLCAVPVFAFAHGGSLDGNGGHYNRSTGEYHYHHGYPAHQHPNGVCPYNFDDKTDRSPGNGSGGGSANPPVVTYAPKATANKNAASVVVTGSSVNVRSSASTNGKILGTVKAGREMTVLGTEGGWYKVRYLYGTGYISASYVSVSATQTPKPTKTPKPTSTPDPTTEPIPEPVRTESPTYTQQISTSATVSKREKDAMIARRRILLLCGAFVTPAILVLAVKAHKKQNEDADAYRVQLLIDEERHQKEMEARRKERERAAAERRKEWERVAEEARQKRRAEEARRKAEEASRKAKEEAWQRTLNDPTVYVRPSTGMYHRSFCQNCPKAYEPRYVYKSRELAESDGYRGCSRCNRNPSHPPKRFQ